MKQRVKPCNNKVQCIKSNLLQCINLMNRGLCTLSDRREQKQALNTIYFIHLPSAPQLIAFRNNKTNQKKYRAATRLSKKLQSFVYPNS